MSKVTLWAVDIVRLGDETIFETLHFLAKNFFELSHICGEYIFQNNDKYDFPVDVINLRKVIGIKEIVNAEDFMDEDESDGYNPEMPYEMAENAPDEQLMKFKCTCKNEVKVMNGNWPYIKCHDCSRTILRKDLENVAGVWIFHPSN